MHLRHVKESFLMSHQCGIRDDSFQFFTPESKCIIYILIDIHVLVCYYVVINTKSGVIMQNEETKPKRKTHTSSAVKNRYNSKTYDKITIAVKKEKAAAYKAKCAELGITLSEPLHKAIDEVLSK